MQTTPIFGSASTFGAGTGFGGFSGVTSSNKEEKKGDEEDDGAAEEEECAAEFKPVVQLDEVEVATGEEDEECLLDMYVISYACPDFIYLYMSDCLYLYVCVQKMQALPLYQ